ncbi:hypothetical protein [Riemerella columbina]|uniref:hypothetical protein n=1 Tax=Riemerella columbina TaxID=103810 RepID=UPI00037A8E1B|nr:hypothetical protein [Riemerella columbina]
MDYLRKIDTIIEILSINNMDFEIEKIKNLRQSSFTSTELLLSVGYELNRMIKNPVIKSIIGNEVKDLIRYCERIGLYIDKV